MARHTKVVVVPHEGRDKGKHFLLTEMSATASEEWAIRAFFAMGRSGVEVPPEVSQLGFAGIAVVGIQALARVHFDDAKPLLEQMMLCVQAMPDPAHPEIVRNLVENDIEEPTTRLWLRSEVLELHTGFSIADAISKSQVAPADSEMLN